ncbi:MAG: 50S ribosomal protein L15 [Candidatus Paceibacterota bacterium]|jgi:large subunit ribosomal protein L15
MQLHQIKPDKRKKRKEIGRGGMHGHSATRGTKGQKARSGRGGKTKSFEGTVTPLFRRTPKLRGFKSLNEKNIVVSIYQLEKNFAAGDIVNPKTLREKDVIRKDKPFVKILADGELKKKLTIEGCIVSKSAEKKIKDAGGDIRPLIKPNIA